MYTTGCRKSFSDWSLVAELCWSPAGQRLRRCLVFTHAHRELRQTVSHAEQLVTHSRSLQWPLRMPWPLEVLHQDKLPDVSNHSSEVSCAASRSLPEAFPSTATKTIVLFLNNALGNFKCPLLKIDIKQEVFRVHVYPERCLWRTGALLGITSHQTLVCSNSLFEF